MPELGAFSIEIEQKKLRERKLKHQSGTLAKAHDFKLKIQLFFLQNLGIFVGFMTMLVLALYGGILEQLFN